MSDNTINKVQQNIKELQDQNAIDFQQWKKLGQDIEKLAGNIKITDTHLNLLMKKIKADYESLKKIIIDENVQIQLNNKIEENKTEINKKVSIKTFENEVNNINSHLDSKAKQIDLEIERNRINNLTSLKDGSTTGDAELIDGRVSITGNTMQNIGENIRESVSVLNNEFVLLSNTIIDNRNLLNHTVNDVGGIHEQIFIFNNKLLKSNTTYVFSLKLSRDSETITPINATQWGFIDFDNSYIGDKVSFNNGVTTNNNVNNYKGIKLQYYSGIETTDIIKSFCLKENGKEDDIFSFEFKSNKLNNIDENIKEINELYNSTINIFNHNSSRVGYYVFNGDIRQYTDISKSVSELIEVIDCKIFTNLTEISNCLAYDKDKNVLGSFQLTGNYDLTSVYPNIKYFVFDYSTENKDKIIISKYDFDNIKYIPNKQIPSMFVENFNNNLINFWENMIGDSLGDSLTEARYFQLHTANFLNLKKFYCHGIGGTRISGNSENAMWQDVRINALNPDAKFVTVLGGQNDDDVTIGEVSFDNTDTNTYVGAYNTIIKKIYAKYNGEIIIVLCSPFYTPSGGNNDNIKAMAKAVRELGKLWGLPVADFGGLSGGNPSTANIYWGTDRIHPLEKFYKEKLTPILVDTLNKVKPINYNICNFVERGIDQNS